MEEDRKRHCWECRRRCLVCDFTRPECKRCSSSGILCPGYDDREPFRLKWLAPGRVKSRNRKHAGNQNGRPAKATAELPVIKKTRDLTRIKIPHFEPITDALLLAQAAEYYNSCIYPDLEPINDLGPNHGIYKLSPTHLQRGAVLPDYLRLGVVCMTLSHRMNRIRNDPQSNSLAVNFFHYRGLVIRSLRSDINEVHKRTSDFVLAGIVTLLLIDAQHGASTYWRFHMEGLQKLITLRGGIRPLARSAGLEPLLHCFVCAAIIGDTTTPASELFMSTQLLEEADFILEQFGSGVFAFLMCPKSLFAEVIKINHLRVRASKQDPAELENLAQEAYQILQRIQFFSSEQWAESKPSSKGDWILVGNLFQAAVIIYCILSLQSLSVLPLTPQLRASCTSNSQLLQILLKDALSSPRTKRFLVWPLVVLGVEAVNGSALMRNFVREQLSELSCYIGSHAPLTAKDVLERFWASGKTDWDACFDRPYMFPMQIAVDISKLS